MRRKHDGPFLDNLPQLGWAPRADAEVDRPLRGRDDIIADRERACHVSRTQRARARIFAGGTAQRDLPQASAPGRRGYDPAPLQLPGAEQARYADQPTPAGKCKGCNADIIRSAITTTAGRTAGIRRGVHGEPLGKASIFAASIAHNAPTRPEDHRHGTAMITATLESARVHYTAHAREASLLNGSVLPKKVME
jgi:hypothetical protein